MDEAGWKRRTAPLLRTIGWAALALTSAPQPTVSPWPELAKGETPLRGPLRPTWQARRTSVHATRVSLRALGARTHGNWLIFRLPFDADQTDRLRGVRFALRSAEPTDVGAVRLGSVCLRLPAHGGLGGWALYTTSGVGWTHVLATHPAAPTRDATLLGVNVPTRVANYAACGWGDGRLDAPETWTLDIHWEER